MLAVIAKAKRENLFQEISRVVRQWPERERQVFSQAHYRGQSPDSIARSFQTDAAEIRMILKLCERRLHNSLRSFRKSEGQPLPIPADAAGPSVGGRVAKAAPASGLKANRLPSVYRKSA